MGGSIQLLIRRIDFLDVMRTADSNALDDIGEWARKNGPPPPPHPTPRCPNFHDDPLPGDELFLISDLLTGFEELDLGHTGVFSPSNTLR